MIIIYSITPYNNNNSQLTSTHRENLSQVVVHIEIFSFFSWFSAFIVLFSFSWKGWGRWRRMESNRMHLVWVWCTELLFINFRRLFFRLDWTRRAVKEGNDGDSRTIAWKSFFSNCPHRHTPIQDAKMDFLLFLVDAIPLLSTRLKITLCPTSLRLDSLISREIWSKKFRIAFGCKFSVGSHVRSSYPCHLTRKWE